MGLSADFNQFVNVVERSGEVENIVCPHVVVASGNDRLMVALYRRHVEIMLSHCKFLKLHAYEPCIVAYLHTHQNQLPPMEFPPMAHPVMLKSGYDFLCGEKFGINEIIYAHTVKKGRMFGQFVLIIVYARHRFRRSKTRCYGTRHHIFCLMRSHRYEQIGVLAHTCLTEAFERGGHSLTCHKIIVRIKIRKTFNLTVNYSDVLLLARKKFRKV